MECMCAQTRPWFILSSERVLGEWSQNPCQPQGQNPLYQKISPHRKIEPMTLHQAQHTTNELFRPLGIQLRCSVLDCVLPLQEVALCQHPPTFCLLLSLSTPSPSVQQCCLSWSSNRPYLLLCASNGPGHSCMQRVHPISIWPWLHIQLSLSLWFFGYWQY